MHEAIFANNFDGFIDAISTDTIDKFDHEKFLSTLEKKLWNDFSDQEFKKIVLRLRELGIPNEKYLERCLTLATQYKCEETVEELSKIKED